MTYALLATLGFDERHVIRSILVMGMEDIDQVILLVPSWDLDPRTKKAIDEIKKIVSIAGIGEENVYVEKIDVENFWSAVRQITEIIKELALEGIKGIRISLGGGLRALIIETYTASLLLRNINIPIIIRIDIESGKQTIEFNLEETPLCYEPSGLEIKIIKTIIEKPETTISELARTLNTPKTTVWKAVQKLQKQKLILKKEKAYIATNAAKTLITLYS